MPRNASACATIDSCALWCSPRFLADPRRQLHQRAFFISKDLPTMTCGIYSITNTKNGKRYIGSAVRFERRWKGHRVALRRGNHHSRHLQAAWNKYGEGAFQFEVVVTCEPEDLISQEQFWIDAFQSADQRYGYNASPTAGSPLGVRHSKETKAKVSAANRGRKYSDAVKARMSAAQMGHKVTDGTKAKIASAAIGRKASAETRAKLSAVRRGRKYTAEARANMSRAQRETQNLPEVKAKVRAAKLGWKYSVEVRARNSAAQREVMARPGAREHLSEVLTGFKHTLETRRKVSAGVREAQARPGALEKIAEANRGKKRSEETKAKMSEIAKRNPGPKLNEDDVRKIRKLLADGVMRVEIAEMFGVSTTCIGHIKTGKNWSHVK